MEFKLTSQPAIQECLNWLHENGLGKRVTVTKLSSKRSIEQNKLQRRWLNEAADQLKDHTAEEYRGYCKLHFGVPIMRAEDEIFAVQYDKIVRPLPYEAKLEIMQVPLDLPVTRLMNVKQTGQYLDAIYQHFKELGVKLTEPDNDN